MSKEEVSLLIYVVAVLLGFTVFGVILFISTQKRKNKFLIESIEARQRFEREIEISRLEIKEQTLRNIGWELHDNVGQLLSVVNMQLNMMLPN
ncbi:MAG: signal transduction histidine kinase, partial [Candidatus Latescibacterota bacterium]